MPSDSKREQDITRIMELMNRNGSVTGLDERYLQQCLTKSCSPSTLRLIEEAAERSNSVAHERSMLEAVLHAPQEQLHDMLFCYLRVSDDISLPMTDYCARGVLHLPRFQGRQVAQLKGEELSVAIALIDVCAALLKHNEDSVTNRADRCAMIKDQELVELVEEHHQHAGIITQFIRDRGAADVEAIRAVLENKVPLGRGVL